MPRKFDVTRMRQAQLLDVAEMLFRRNGYGTTSVEDIARETCIAKATFYHHFRSKDEVLNALAGRLVDSMAMQFRQIAGDTSIDPMQKVRLMVSATGRSSDGGPDHTHEHHGPLSREFWDVARLEFVRVLGPIVASVIDQGNRSRDFKVADPLSTAQFIVAGSLLLLGEGIFNWTSEERTARMQAVEVLVKRALCSEVGSRTKGSTGRRRHP